VTVPKRGFPIGKPLLFGEIMHSLMGKHTFIIVIPAPRFRGNKLQPESKIQTTVIPRIFALQIIGGKFQGNPSMLPFHPSGLLSASLPKAMWIP
jgi:hypothetical protein